MAPYGTHANSWSFLEFGKKNFCTVFKLFSVIILISVPSYSFCYTSKHL